MSSSRNKFIDTNRIRQIMPIAVILLGSAWLVAQYQVNRQINRGGGPPSVRYASPAFGSNPYGGNPYASGLYAQPANRSSSMMLPSQERYAYARSGALPSDVRMNYGSVGPLAPSGSVAYLPPSQNYNAPQRSVTSGNMVNAQAARPNGAMPSYTMPSAGSVKYAPAPRYQSSLAPSSSLGFAPKSGLSGQTPYNQTVTGTIRF